MTDLSGKASQTSMGAGEWASIRKVGFDAPWRWLGAGWNDLWANPSASLPFGIIAFAGAVMIAGTLFEIRALPALLPLYGGFLLLGPLFAVGLYDISRQREKGFYPSLRTAIGASYTASGRLALFGVVLLLIYFFWVRLAFLIFMLFFGTENLPPLEIFIPRLLFTTEGLGLLVVGTAVGAILSAVSFALSAIAVPMIFDRQTDPITAASVSVQSVVRNTKAMALWAVLIVAATVTGFATLFLGLIVVFPLLGHASWHAYRDLVAFHE